MSAQLVLVPVTVTDDGGAPVTGLASSVFTVFEENTPRPIVSFSEEDLPSSIGIIFDLSGSMKDRLDVARSAFRAFVQFAEPDDEAFLMTVADHPVTRSGFTDNFGSLLGGLFFGQASGSTALVDTIYLGLSNLRHGRNPRKSLIVISDGMDNHSRYSAGELASAAMESDIQIHTIALSELPVNAKGREVEERAKGVLFLRKLSLKSGGLHYAARRDSDLTESARNIGRSIRSQYVIGYRPVSLDVSGKWKPIKVKLNLPRTRAHARLGYFSR
ncbi:MAG: VWA domain-containing protein [Acidobacteria bacterium]|nr:VWA domain-containing protein [Acidobacteriota bacterium]